MRKKQLAQATFMLQSVYSTEGMIDTCQPTHQIVSKTETLCFLIYK